MDDAFLQDILIGIYKQMRIQQEMLSKTGLEIAALSTVLQSSPQFREMYEKAYADLEHGPTAETLAASLKAIDASIAGLRTGGRKQGKEN